MPPRPGEIYWAFVEGGDRRPIIVVSREELNRGNYVVAVPLTSARLDLRRSLPNGVAFSAGEHGLTKDCVAQAEAITLLELSDLDLQTGCLGALDSQTSRRLIQAIGYVLAAACEPE